MVNIFFVTGCAAGIGIKAALDTSEIPIGRLTILGTPAEEDGGGKSLMIKNGCFDDVDIAMMVHPMPVEMPHALFVAIHQWVITYSGKASHAAAFPWEGVNALDAAIAAYNGISVLRQQMRPSWRVHGIISNGGTKPNIIPEKSELQYLLRAPTESELETLIEKARAIFLAAGQTTGCSVDIKDEDHCMNLVSNKTLLDLYTRNSLDLGVQFTPDHVPGIGNIHDIPLGSTDMGDVSYEVPSIHPVYSIGTHAFNHTREFTAAANTDFAHERTLVASKAIAGCAIDVLTDPEALKAVKDSFKLQMQQV